MTLSFSKLLLRKSPGSMFIIQNLKRLPGWLFLAIGLTLIGCAPESFSPPPPIEAVSQIDRPVGMAIETPLKPTQIPSPTTIPTIAVRPSETALPTVTPTATPLPTATATPIGSCASRIPEDDLFSVVTLDYNLSRDYKPADLVPLSEWLPLNVTLGYPTEIRQVALQPLISMIEDMQADGLDPKIISGYRSYAAQAIAWNKWNEQYPDHASIISAPPGHSEHQLGTVVDFGSPELDEIVGQEDIEFHTLFYKTSEGAWLIENAYKYGFTLSYPLEAFELTGFYYEPWHYRYVGVDMAIKLRDLGMSLTEYQLLNHDQPCIPQQD